MKEFEPLIGEWHGAGQIRMEPPMLISEEANIERMGEFIVFRTVGEPAEMPDSIAIIGGAPAGDPQPMHYFDSRGVQRLYLTTVDASIWKIWRSPDEDWNGPQGPGFNQRFIGAIATDGETIKGRWERGMGTSGEQWEIDFPITYVRKSRRRSRAAGQDSQPIRFRDWAEARGAGPAVAGGSAARKARFGERVMDLEIIVDEKVPGNAIYVSVAADGRLSVTVSPSVDRIVLSALRTDISTAVTTAIKPA
jgi:hypothetical protein